MERFSLGSALVMQLSLADVITYQVPLTPREAAAITLAVAEQWNWWCATHQVSGSLPEPSAILLHQSGTVSFVSNDSTDAGDCGAALSALLSGLLGLDEDAAHEPKPFAYPAALRHAVGHAEGAADADAFRAALMRFAAADPVVLRSVFWRAVRIIGSSTTPTLPVSFEARRRARPRTERRKRGLAASDLRREIRLLEQDIYNTRVQRPPTTTRMARPRLALGVAAVCSLVVVTVALARTVFAPAHQNDVNAEHVDTVLPSQAAAVVSPAKTPAVAVSSPARRPVRTTRVVVTSRPTGHHRGPVRAPAGRSPSTTVFAGGTRGVAWMLHAP